MAEIVPEVLDRVLLYVRDVKLPVAPTRFPCTVRFPVLVCVAVTRLEVLRETKLAVPPVNVAVEVVPVKVGFTALAFRASAAAWAVLTGFELSLVLSTFPRPIIEGTMLLRLGLMEGAEGQDAARAPE